MVRWTLGCLTPFYRIAVWFRNRQFDTGSRPIESVDVPVISIGNLTTGGTGKTPLVVWVCQLLRRHDVRVAIVSRGYGAEQQDGKISLNDEALELEHRLPDVPHLQDSDRVKIARIAIEELEPESIVLDDGFQHRRLRRDLDIVLIDATNPFGYGRLLPRGLLREPIGALRRCDAIVVTRCELVDEAQLDQIVSRIERAAADRPVALAKTVIKGLIQHSGSAPELETASTKKWLAFSAIGNPAAFEASLSSNGFQVCNSIRFRDHHTFDRADLASIAAAARACGADSLICTHKDLVKIATNRIEGLPVFALQIGVELFRGGDAIEQSVLRLFDRDRTD